MTALISGCSSGFGLLAAVELAQAGFHVVATLRNLEKRAKLDEAAAAAGVQLTVRQLDVTDPASIARCLDETGPVEVLVNNAGYGLAGFVEDVTLDELRAQFETNFFGLWSLTRAVIPGMRERRSGRVINISSIGGLRAVPGLSSYCASKFAVEGMSEALRYELRPFGVHVSIIEPGTFKTEIFESNQRTAARATSPDSPYRTYSEKMLALARQHVENSRHDPREVAVAIRRAATAKRPRLRYLVGSDALINAWAQHILPPRVFEELVMRMTLERR